MITNIESNTRIDEIAEGIYRISTPVPPSAIPGGFSYNQYLVVDDDPLLFHTGPRRLFALVRQAVDAVLPAERLRYVCLSHVESDECGSLNDFLAIAPRAEPLCSEIAAKISLGDLADRTPRGLADGEELVLGRRTVRWVDAPHLPHAWECGYLFDLRSRTLLCGDLFTQPGAENPALTTGDVLGPSEAMRAGLDYFAHGRGDTDRLERLAALGPSTLACMHGSAWHGDAPALLRALGRALTMG
jgi:flavorubredoxin